MVEALDPDELRAVLVGVRRHQLRRHLDEEAVRDALAGDRAAVRRLRAAVDQTLLQVSPWLLRTPAVSLKQLCLDTLAAVPPPAEQAPDASTATARLAEAGPARLIEEVAPGVHYGPQVLDDVVLVTSAQVAPILVVVDEVDRTVILHPPLGDAGATDAGAQLRDLGRAVGDATRLRLLQELRTGPRTLVDLTTALDSPRTTLLHHLALLRSAGLIEIAVVDGRAERLHAAPRRLRAAGPGSQGLPAELVRAHTDAPVESATGASDGARSRGYLTSERITSQSPMAIGRASQTEPVTASWAQSCPVKPPSKSPLAL